MAYTPTTWKDGDVITAAKMNKLEQGVKDAGGGVSSGVTSFNGRTGAVAPQTGDYTAAQVGARPDTWTPTAADVGAATPADVSTAVSGKVSSTSVTTIQAVTQTQYDALTTKNATTLYLIKE